MGKTGYPVELTDEQKAYLQDLKSEPDITWRDIARLFNAKFDKEFSDQALRKKWYRLVSSGEVEHQPAGDRALAQTLVRQNEALRRDLKKERIKTQQVVDACTSAILKHNIKPIKRPPASSKKSKHNLDAHLLRTDAQAGERVNPRETSGLGDYNFNVYKDRVRRLRDKVLLFREQDKTSLGLDKLVIPWLGDHVEGETVYPGQAYHIDKILVDQVFESAFFEINEFILPLAAEFPRLEIFTVYGNHGRAGRKGDNHFRTNWDYVFYMMLKTVLHFAAPHVKVFVSDSPTMLVEHGNFLFCYKHGDDVRGWMGLPYYGLDRMARRTSKMFNKSVDYYCVGHFHRPASLDDHILVGGTLAGGSDLSINKLGLTSVPSQKLFYFHRRHGVNRTSNLYLSDQVNLTPDEHGIYTPTVPELQLGRVDNAKGQGS